MQRLLRPLKIASVDEGGSFSLRDPGLKRIEGTDQDVRYTLSGDFDFINEPSLTCALTSDVRHREIIIDLGGLTFIDASIIGALAHFAGRRLAIEAAPVHIVNASARLRKLFSICNLESVFDFSAA